MDVVLDFLHASRIYPKVRSNTETDSMGQPNSPIRLERLTIETHRVPKFGPEIQLNGNLTLGEVHLFKTRNRAFLLLVRSNANKVQSNHESRHSFRIGSQNLNCHHMGAGFELQFFKDQHPGCHNFGLIQIDRLS